MKRFLNKTNLVITLLSALLALACWHGISASYRATAAEQKVVEVLTQSKKNQEKLDHAMYTAKYMQDEARKIIDQDRIKNPPNLAYTGSAPLETFDRISLDDLNKMQMTGMPVGKIYKVSAELNGRELGQVVLCSKISGIGCDPYGITVLLKADLSSEKSTLLYSLMKGSVCATVRYSGGWILLTDIIGGRC